MVIVFFADDDWMVFFRRFSKIESNQIYCVVLKVIQFFLLLSNYKILKSDYSAGPLFLVYAHL